MTDFLDCLTERGRASLAVICCQLGWEFHPAPRKNVTIDAKLETTDEIDHEMRIKPHFSRRDDETD